MARFGDCQTCKALVVELATHVCPPAWMVSWPYFGTVEREVYALTPEEAAERYCLRFDASDLENGIIISGEARLSVRRADQVTQVDVLAETRPHYRALEVLP